MSSQIGGMEVPRFLERYLYFGILSLFFVLAFSSSVSAAWVDADGSGQESVNILMTPGISTRPSLSLDSSRTPYIVWEDTSPGNSEIYLLKWNGSAWVGVDGSSTSINITNNTSPSQYPSLCLDSSGNPHIAWHDLIFANNEIYYLKWNGSEWVDADGSGQESNNISQTAYSSFYPSLVLDNSGNPHIAWKDFVSGENYDIYYLKWNGLEWVDADGSGRESINVSTNTGYSGFPSLCVDSSGNPHIAWEDSTSGQSAIYYLKWNGSEWVDVDGSGQESINVSKDSGQSRNPSLYLDSTGNPHIAWDNGGTELYNIYYLKWNGSEWVDADGFGQESINVSGNLGYLGFPSLCLDSLGNPHIAFSNHISGENYDIYYLKWNGTAWVDVDGSGQELKNVSNNPGNSVIPSLYLDSFGKPHIAWADSTSGNYDIYYLYWNIPPTLSWTGEPNYTADGLHPQAGYPNTNFVYRVKYTDQDNNPPASGYPKLHIKKAGVPIEESPFTMEQVDPGDIDYTDGKLYTFTKSRLGPGSDYNYYFEAKDVWNSPATGAPTTPIDAPDVTNHLPTLSWTGEADYTSDGLNPETGYPDTNFVYRVKYTDQDDDPPASGYPKLHIKKAGVPIEGSPFTMEQVDPGDIDYTDGKLYTFSKGGLARGNDYTYYFEAKDLWNGSATGPPTTPIDAPDVVNHAPTLSWTGEADYTSDGLNPETGYPDTNFVYRVKYIDQDDDPPASGYPKLHIKKAGVEIGGSPFTMEQVDPGDIDYTDGKLYTFTKSRLGPGSDYNYYFEARDSWNGSATGPPTTPSDAPDVENHTPTLSWTGEADYTSDGLNPETGYPDTNFVYRVKYTDQDDDPPASGYPRLHIKNAGIEIEESPFPMEQFDPGDIDYTDGKLYTFTKSRLGPSHDYTYYFEARDVWDIPATGPPTTPSDAPDVENNPPTLSWTGETNYTVDGLEPEAGYPDTNFVYRVKYTDKNDDPPASGYPRLHIKNAGVEIGGSPFPMNQVDPGDIDYTDGKLYTFTKSRLGPSHDYTYYFEARDVWDIPATGPPTTPSDAPDVENNPPTLSWTGETNYTSDGLNPEIGYTVTDFVYRVKYADQDNDAPASGYPKVHIVKGGLEISGSPFAMGEVNAKDTTYNDGKLYTYAKSMLAPGTDYTYYFEAKDLWNASATGKATGPVDAPNVEPIQFSEKGDVRIQGGKNGYINPLKGEVARIHFWPSGPGKVNVEIFDLIGLLVWEKSKDVSEAQDVIEWDCRNDKNDVVASGIYLVYVEGPGIKATKKAAVLK